MRFVRTLALGIAVGVALAAVTEASAGRFDDYDRPSWTNFYIGALIGYGIGTPEASMGGASVSFSAEGVQGVLAVGYDLQVGRGLVLGVLGDYAFGNVEGNVGPLNFKLSNQWAVGTRFGLLASPSSLWFATGGYTQVDIEASMLSVDKTLSGFFVGGGVEQALDRTFSVKLEYRYSNYEDVKVGPVTVTNEIHSARLGANLRF